MIILTGAAGFIGSCILARLNALGRGDIYLVDEMNHDSKKRNIENKKFKKFIDKKEFLKLVKSRQVDGSVEAVIHMGACSSTLLRDAQYYEENNYEYTKVLAEWALEHRIRFIYASSAATYGDGSCGYKDDEATLRRCKPLNFYGQSKQKFDEWVLEHSVINQLAGLKFFNVFGPNEYHKGDMRSVIAKAYDRVAKEGRISLFKSYKEEYKDGEQKRDFIYVKDAVDVVLFFLENPKINGIFNLGSGKARTWNDLAKALFAAVGKPLHIDYIDMPAHLRQQYQYFTEADMTKLFQCGYKKIFTPLEEAVYDYVQYLKHHAYL
ncbi:MAG: ADP-glyceromanno-heptose 6-epimerase [Omnitrophica WOR_2 bacterium RIFCSPHIGHO2_01_FULL_48_9]|nr:MAG: ADP-glyceromanno-heptose 6-epimerase [Omnitrophica WOR_2 bacterium RIFCSPHIGHO2_02_FULL_48_11]OGX31268.1 MAG: ADP-glyceromanno-heptose 6-epimerase [Omnitrophica WOR_2 bacterium RIFCSPHIGHO2_01_FULL_48_9]